MSRIRYDQFSPADAFAVPCKVVGESNPFDKHAAELRNLYDAYVDTGGFPPDVAVEFVKAQLDGFARERVIEAEIRLERLRQRRK